MRNNLYNIDSYNDFPELIGEYFVDVKAIINRVLGPINLSIINTKVDSISEEKIYFDIKSKDTLETLYLDFDSETIKEEFLKKIVGKVNETIKSNSINDEIIFKKASTDNESYNNCNYYFHLLSEKEAITFEDIRPTNSIEFYEYAYDLPFHSKKELNLVFNSIANLNENNTLSFEFVDLPDNSEGSITDLKVLYKTEEKQEIYEFNIYDTEAIGLNINHFLGLNDEKYSACFINDNETIVCSYCTKIEFFELCKYQFIAPKYLPPSSEYNDIFFTHEHFPLNESTIKETYENLEKTFGKSGFEKVKSFFKKKRNK